MQGVRSLKVFEIHIFINRNDLIISLISEACKKLINLFILYEQCTTVYNQIKLQIIENFERIHFLVDI